MDSFQQAQELLLEHQLSIQLCLKYFIAYVRPALLFGTIVLPFSRFQYLEFDKLQNQVLRRIVDSRRIEGE